MQQHDGLLHVTSKVGRGTTFEICLPGHDAAAAPRSGVDSGLAGSPRGSETILIAEDEELVRRPAVQILSRAGYRTLVASNGREALRLLDEHEGTVDLALLDIVMPELGGPETWEQMRARHPELKVLFVTGYANDRYREHLPEGTQIIEKPFRAPTLLRRIRDALDS